MPVAKSSPSVPGFRQESQQSIKDVGVGQMRRVKRIYNTKKSPQRAAATAGIVAGLAILFPLPFTIAGVIAVVDDALNLADERDELKAFLQEAVETVGKAQATTKRSKKTRGHVTTPAPAAG